MARYKGPVCRLCRRHGDKLYLKGDRCMGPKCAFERRPTPPGQQLRFGRRRRISDRALQLREKQRGRLTYGMVEGQFRRSYHAAMRRPGVTGHHPLRFLAQRAANGAPPPGSLLTTPPGRPPPQRLPPAHDPERNRCRTPSTQGMHPIPQSRLVVLAQTHANRFL